MCFFFSLEYKGVVLVLVGKLFMWVGRNAFLVSFLFVG